MPLQAGAFVTLHDDVARVDKLDHVTKLHDVLVLDLPQHVDLPHHVAHHRARAAVGAVPREVYFDGEPRRHPWPARPPHGGLFLVLPHRRLDHLTIGALPDLRTQLEQRQQLVRSHAIANGRIRLKQVDGGIHDVLPTNGGGGQAPAWRLGRRRRRHKSQRVDGWVALQELRLLVQLQPSERRNHCLAPKPMAREVSDLDTGKRAFRRELCHRAGGGVVHAVLGEALKHLEDARSRNVDVAGDNCIVVVKPMAQLCDAIAGLTRRHAAERRDGFVTLHLHEGVAFAVLARGAAVRARRPVQRGRCCVDESIRLGARRQLDGGNLAQQLPVVELLGADDEEGVVVGEGVFGHHDRVGQVAPERGRHVHVVDHHPVRDVLLHGRLDLVGVLAEREHGPLDTRAPQTVEQVQN
mmetsp:Transcript_57399/g.150726  ORF Transcript_57399/g.150726 Transcript_57399/m.150726 type:complete len:410 (+) Transcript_57399:1105-2334(+)